MNEPHAIITILLPFPLLVVLTQCEIGNISGVQLIWQIECQTAKGILRRLSDFPFDFEQCNVSLDTKDTEEELGWLIEC